MPGPHTNIGSHAGQVSCGMTLGGNVCVYCVWQAYLYTDDLLVFVLLGQCVEPLLLHPRCYCSRPDVHAVVVVQACQHNVAKRAPN